jgi:hypothetical protein
VPDSGWYADPSGGPGARWWDGTAWTTQTQPPTDAPAPQGPPIAQPAAPIAQPGAPAAQQAAPTAPATAYAPPASTGGIVDAKAGKHRVYADGQVISYGGKTLQLAAVDWVCYFVKRPKGANYGVLIGSKKKTLGSYFYFQIGHHPYFEGEFIEVHLPRWGDVGSDPVWESLVDHARRHVEPRLVAQITAQLAAGQTVALGPLTLDPAGIKSPAGALGWREISGAALVDEEIHLFRDSATVLKVDQANWNAALLPALVPAAKAALAQ